MKGNMKTRWKFLREGLRSQKGDCAWKIGEWKHYERDLILCASGYHCSGQINQAYNFLTGEILARVQVKGKSITQDNKEVWSDMRLVKAWKWQKEDSVALAIYVAEKCLWIFEKKYPDDKTSRLTIEAAKAWIKNLTDETASAARAAYSASSAAHSAAHSAVSAAYSAVSAARASSAALTEKIRAWMKKRVKQLEIHTCE